MPEGETPPKISRPREPFEVVATIRPTAERPFMIVAVDGMERPMEDEEEAGGTLAAIRARSGVILGILGLAAWLALIWFMFGDVL